MIFTEYPDRDSLVLGLTDRIVGALSGALMIHDRASLAVPGGTTPGPVLEALSGADLDWARVDVTLTDERWVPEDSPRSNTRLLRERLLVGRAGAARLVPLHDSTDRPEDAVATLEAGLRAILPLTVVLLGMGEDLHTASLFPGADKLHAALSAGAPALVAIRAPGAPEPRVTMTAPVLNGAMSKHMMITGTAKRAALARAETLRRVEDAPIRAVLRDLNVHWAL